MFIFVSLFVSGHLGSVYTFYTIFVSLFVSGHLGSVYTFYTIFELYYLYYNYKNERKSIKRH
jgi:low affinity Fe/Cu permease